MNTRSNSPFKSQQGQKGTVGAPSKPIQGLTVNKVRGAFTVATIIALNKDLVSELTIRNTMKKMRKRQLITRNKETVQSGDTSGRPSFSYVHTARNPKKTKSKAVVESPAVETTPAPAPTVVAPEPTTVVG